MAKINTLKSSKLKSNNLNLSISSLATLFSELKSKEYDKAGWMLTYLLNPVEIIEDLTEKIKSGKESCTIECMMKFINSVTGLYSRVPIYSKSNINVSAFEECEDLKDIDFVKHMYQTIKNASNDLFMAYLDTIRETKSIDKIVTDKILYYNMLPDKEIDKSNTWVTEEHMKTVAKWTALNICKKHKLQKKNINLYKIVYSYLSGNKVKLSDIEKVFITAMPFLSVSRNYDCFYLANIFMLPFMFKPDLLFDDICDSSIYINLKNSGNANNLTSILNAIRKDFKAPCTVNLDYIDDKPYLNRDYDKLHMVQMLRFINLGNLAEFYRNDYDKQIVRCNFIHRFMYYFKDVDITKITQDQVETMLDNSIQLCTSSLFPMLNGRMTDREYTSMTTTRKVPFTDGAISNSYYSNKVDSTLCDTSGMYDSIISEDGNFVTAKVSSNYGKDYITPDEVFNRTKLEQTKATFTTKTYALDILEEEYQKYIQNPDEYMNIFWMWNYIINSASQNLTTVNKEKFIKYILMCLIFNRDSWENPSELFKNRPEARFFIGEYLAMRIFTNEVFFDNPNFKEVIFRLSLKDPYIKVKLDEFKSKIDMWKKTYQLRKNAGIQK